MENNKKSFWKRISAIILSSFLLFAKGDGLTSAQVLPDPEAPKISSEMNAEEMNNFYNLKKHFEGLEQSAEQVISLEDTFSTPVDGEVCDTMVPQGLAIKDGLILVTAYDGINGYKEELKLHSYKKEYREKLAKENDHKVHNSVIIVLDQKTKKVITTLELSDRNHVGGIAVDDENVYIAKSADEKISVISFDKIKSLVKLGLDQGVKSAKVDYDYDLDVKQDASFISIRHTKSGKEQLVVGTWHPFPGVSKIGIYDFGNNNNLTLSQEFQTNSSANGATFIRRDDKEYFIVACSLGRLLNSNMYVYEVDEGKDGKLSMDFRSQTALPPMVEELAEFEDEDGTRKLAIGSEAFSKRYEIGKSKVISDGIIIAKLDNVLDRRNKPKRVLSLEDIYKEDNDDVKVVSEEEDERGE